MTAHDDGLIIVDKPRGPTSHDVVARLRRTLGTRSIGHAGTLDPMATGVLLIMVGACTKLSRFLTLDDKAYEATVRLGVGTDTMDAEGAETERCDVPAALASALQSVARGSTPDDDMWREAIEGERRRVAQVPPAHSAIKQGGVASYRKARRGEVVELAERGVEVKALDVTGARAEPPELDLRLEVSKGYYVRSLARDLGQALGVPAHLTALRRVRSGPYDLARALAWDTDAAQLRAALLPLGEVARDHLQSADLTEEGARRALHGQRLSDSDFREPPGEGTSAWYLSGGRLAAVGERADGRPTILRAFLHASEMC